MTWFQSFRTESLYSLKKVFIIMCSLQQHRAEWTGRGDTAVVASTFRLIITLNTVLMVIISTLVVTFHPLYLAQHSKHQYFTSVHLMMQVILSKKSSFINWKLGHCGMTLIVFPWNMLMHNWLLFMRNLCSVTQTSIS